jgi:hypothetical protein
MSDELLVGLAGGAIGAVLTAILGQAGRAWLAWGEVTLHDQEASDRNRRLRVWVDDRTRLLVQRMRAHTTHLAAEGQLYSGAHGRAVAEEKAKALHEFRDEVEQANIDLARLRTKEGAWHSWWRTVRRRPVPAVTAAAEVEPFIERWREPVTRHGDSTNPIVPLDRTRRTFQDALAELPSLELN